MCNPKVCTVASVLPRSGSFRLLTRAEERKYTCMVCTVCCPPVLPAPIWTRRVRSKREGSRTAFLFDQVHWTPLWLKSQGFLGGCKAQPWQDLTSSEPLTPMEQQHWNNTALQPGTTEPPPTDGCTGHWTAASGDHGDPTLLDYEVLCFQPALGKSCNAPPIGKKKPKRRSCQVW